MSGRLRLPVLAAALLLSRPASGASPEAPCAGFTPPTRLSTGNVTLPSSYLAARVGGEVVDEIVVGKDGTVAAVRPVRATIAELAPFAESSVRRSRFQAASIEGNPVAARILIKTQVGTTQARREPPFDTVWANVPGGQSREARWQLAGSVAKLELSVHLGTSAPEGARAVAVAPGGSERVLWKGKAGAAPAEIRETVKTGRFLEDAGDYRLELRAGGRVLAMTTVTIAPDFTAAIVNACEPLP